ncbi:hypothetical protein [Thetidibacter halocola]|nr:hypothetical protein [Thetidibacter halocola]
MIQTVTDAMSRNKATLWQDALGVISLSVILFGALHLPALI